MTTLVTILSFKSMKSMNPIFIAISILVISIMSALPLFNSTNSSWMAFVLLLTFSSGMMTLFMYTASMTANEKSKNKKNMFIALVAMMIMIMPTQSNMMSTNKTMKSFSNGTMIMVMAMILISTMIALAIHGHHPSQTISASF